MNRCAAALALLAACALAALTAAPAAAGGLVDITASHLICGMLGGDSTLNGCVAE